MKNDKEVVLLGPQELVVDSKDLKPESISLDDFVNKVKKMPSLGFNAHQRIYTALRMFGHQEDKHGRRRWNWLDDWVDMPGDELHEREVHGVEDKAEMIMAHLDEATVNKEQQRKYIVLVGPPGSAKSTLVKLMSKTLNAFGTLDQGSIYTAEFDLKKYKEHFSGLETMVCPAHENPLNYLPRKELKELLKKINSKIEEPWQKLSLISDLCPACNYTVNTLRTLDVDLNEVLSIRRIYHEDPEGIGHSSILTEFRPTDEKNYDAKKIFGGGLHFKRFKMFEHDTHPLVIEYGMGGHHDGPSAQRGIVHISEFFKFEKPALNEFLDAVQEKALEVDNRYKVHLDLLLIATSNLSEYQEKGVDDKSLGGYLTSRGVIIPAPYVVVLDDFTKALEKRVFTPKNTMRTHIPPHFVKQVMGVLNVISALEEPEGFEIDLRSKMDLYNHTSSPGLESEAEELRAELIRSATQKPLGEIEEGIKRGFHFRYFQDITKHFKIALNRLDIPAELRDERYDNCLANLSRLDQLLIDTVKSHEAINEETRKRAREKALPLALTLYQNKLAEDVSIALMGNKTMELEAAKYLAMVFASARKNRSYTNPETQQSQPIDEDLLEKMDEYCGVRSPKEFRQFYAGAYNHRVGKDGIKDVKELAKILLDDDTRFRAMVQKYVIEEILPRNVDSVSTAYSPDNTQLVDTLKERFGYCTSCAYFAISAAAVSRKDKEASMFSGCDGNCGSCST